MKEAKEQELSTVHADLAKMDKETAARETSALSAGVEKEGLEAQILADEGHIESVESSFAAKKEEWKTRSELRAGELAAISQAIEILHNDGARDNFKKSFASQGFSLLQLGRRSGEL